MTQFPVTNRSTVERCEHALQHALEGVVDAAERLDKERARIGMPPAAKTFFFAAEVEELIAQRLAEHEAARAAAAKAQAAADREAAESARERRRRMHEFMGRAARARA